MSWAERLNVEVPDPGCKGGVAQAAGSDALVISTAASCKGRTTTPPPHHPAPPAFCTRLRPRPSSQGLVPLLLCAGVNQTVFLSTKNGAPGSWQYRQFVHPKSGYSTLQVNDDGMIANLFEQGGCSFTLALIDPKEMIKDGPQASTPALARRFSPRRAAFPTPRRCVSGSDSLFRCRLPEQPTAAPRRHQWLFGLLRRPSAAPAASSLPRVPEEAGRALPEPQRERHEELLCVCPHTPSRPLYSRWTSEPGHGLHQPARPGLKLLRVLAQTRRCRMARKATRATCRSSHATRTDALANRPSRASTTPLPWHFESLPALSACRLGDGPYARACLGRWPHGLPEGPCSSATSHTSWKCYSALALTPDKSAWSNKAKHPNAYCSGPGAALAAIAKGC